VAAEEATGRPSIDCGDGSAVELRRRKSPKIMSIDLEQLPEVYLLRIEKVPDKNKIGEVCKAGEKVPGVEYDAERRTQKVHWGP
jgi:hypothetical protein